MMVKVEYLADHPKQVEVIARWLFEEWGQHIPGSPVERTIEALNRRLNRDKLPLALVALENGRPLGTVSLKIREMEIRPQYEHWLGSLFVAEGYRHEGIGSRLIEAAKEEAERLGIQRLYLYTRREGTRRLYQRHGWVEVERPHYRGRPAIIMIAELDP